VKCLIAEDHLLSRRIIKELLPPQFDCDMAMNGQEAIDSFVLAHESKRPYEVIFLDIMMPEVDGLEALMCIRALERKMEIPHALAVKVVMTTALDDPHTVFKSLNECEADAFIVKPLSKLKLITELRNLKLVP
jgi:two-component system, chemotaxis family, chemotaxis protein CheY